MRTTLHRYLIEEQLTPMSVSFVGLTLILITGRLLQLALYLFTSSLGLWDLVQLMALAMPKLILYALPMATLIGVLLAFVRLNSDNELVALRAAGVAFNEFLPAVLGVLSLVTFLSFCNTVLLIPSSNAAFEQKIKTLGRAGLPMLLKEGTFIDTIPKLVFFFRSVNPRDLSIEGVFVQDQREEKVRMAIVAEQAQFVSQQDLNLLTFRIRNGIITRISDNFKDAQSVSFKEYDLTLSMSDLVGSPGKAKSKDRREMSLSELLQAIRHESQGKNPRYSLELHQRLALPFACLLLGLVGAPLGSLFRQGGRMLGITLGIGIFLAYYVALSAGKGLGENNLLPPWVAIWTPNLLALCVALYLWVKVHRETPFRLSSAWEHLTHRLQSRLARCPAHSNERLP